MDHSSQHTAPLVGGGHERTDHEQADHQHAGHAPASGSSWRTASQATLHCLTGCAIGEVLGMVIGTAIGLSAGATSLSPWPWPSSSATRSPCGAW